MQGRNKNKVMLFHWRYQTQGKLDILCIEEERNRNYELILSIFSQQTLKFLFLNIQCGIGKLFKLRENENNSDI